MTSKEFYTSLDIRNDKRTYWNFIKLPFILTLRIPLVLLFWFIVWLGEHVEYITLPGWNRK